MGKWVWKGEYEAPTNVGIKMRFSTWRENLNWEREREFVEKCLRHLCMMLLVHLRGILLRTFSTKPDVVEDCSMKESSFILHYNTRNNSKNQPYNWIIWHIDQTFTQFPINCDMRLLVSQMWCAVFAEYKPKWNKKERVYKFHLRV